MWGIRNERGTENCRLSSDRQYWEKGERVEGGTRRRGVDVENERCQSHTRHDVHNKSSPSDSISFELSEREVSLPIPSKSPSPLTPPASISNLLVPLCPLSCTCAHKQPRK